MAEIYLKNFIGASMVFIVYHLLASISFFRAAALFEISSMLYYFIAIPIFAFANASSYILIRSRFKNWSGIWNFLILLFIVNLLLGRIPLTTTVPMGNNPYLDDVLYWIRWLGSFIPLLFINVLYKKLSNWQRMMVITSPFVFILGVLVLLQFPI